MMHKNNIYNYEKTENLLNIQNINVNEKAKFVQNTDKVNENDSEFYLHNRPEILIDSPQSYNYNNIILEDVQNENEIIQKNSIKRRRPQSCKQQAGLKNKMRRSYKPTNKFHNQQNIQNNDLIRIRGDFDTMKLSENTINYKYNDYSRYMSINDKNEHKESLNKKKGLIKTKYAAYSSSIYSLNEKQLYFTSKSKKRKFTSSNSSVKNCKRKSASSNNRSNDKDWIDDLSMLGNFISIKDDNHISSLNNNARINEIKEIAKNADSLIEILQNLKRAV